jgi:hypothetical protein
VNDAATRAVQFLQAASEGIRVVVRYRLDDGRATDALGPLLLVDATLCVVETQRGRETIALADVIAAKAVPPRALRVVR